MTIDCRKGDLELQVIKGWLQKTHTLHMFVRQADQEGAKLGVFQDDTFFIRK